MINIGLNLRIQSIFLLYLSCLILIAGLVEFAMTGYVEAFYCFGNSALITLFYSLVLLLCNFNTDKKYDFGLRDVFVIVTLSWITLAIFAALPFYFSGLYVSYIDAFFESMSGLTTTGASVLQNFNNLTPGIALWRGILQWIGGIGIIVLGVAIMPQLKTGNIRLFRSESSDTGEKFWPQAERISRHILLVYVFLTFVCAFLLFVVGRVSWFDAWIHAMTTISTGGFGNYSNSIAAFDSIAVEIIIMCFMFLAALPFSLLSVAFLYGKFFHLWQDDQIQWFAKIIFTAFIFMTLWLIWQQYFNPTSAIRKSLFQVISIGTGTGFSTDSYEYWGSLSSIIFLILNCIGGCTGSAACGLKALRIMISQRLSMKQIYSTIHPFHVRGIYYNNHLLPVSMLTSVISFCFIYFIFFGLIVAILSLFDLDLITTISATASCMSNLGPGLGDVVGSSGNFSSLPDVVKAVLTSAMLLGRLEFIPILVLFSRHFWK